MADLKIAIDFVLGQEDSTLSGEVTDDPLDLGGPTRFGISSAAHPELVLLGYFDPTRVPREAALLMAENVYSQAYAIPLHVAEIKDQAVATAILSFCVNVGYRHAVLALQHAAHLCGAKLAADGVLGSASIAALNDVLPGPLLGAFTAEAKAYYQHIVENNPAQIRFLKGWLNRADAWIASAAELTLLAS